jgi:hypothetical protein
MRINIDEKTIFREEKLAYLRIYYKTGKKIQYREVDVLEITEDSSSSQWLRIIWETKTYQDIKLIPKEAIGEIAFSKKIEENKE